MKLRRFRKFRPTAVAWAPMALRAAIGAAAGPAASAAAAATATASSAPVAAQDPAPAAAQDPGRGLATSTAPAPALFSGLSDAYDDQLVERAHGQWQFGDWLSLAALDRETLQQHPARARLALLAAAGHQQLGDTVSARQFTRLALGWGCSPRQVGQILIAGVHNTLGRAAALSEQPTRAQNHFSAAIATGSPGTDVRLFAQARTNQQLEQLGQVAEAGRVAALSAATAPSASAPARPRFALRQLDRRQIGVPLPASADARRPGRLLTDGGLQFAAWLLSGQTLRLAARDLKTGAVTLRDMAGDYALRPGAPAPEIGIDRAGHLHLLYTHPDGRSGCRRSTEPRTIKQWSYESSPEPSPEPALGSALGSSSHPVLDETSPAPAIAERRFVPPRAGQPLGLLSRTAGGQGALRLSHYDETRQTWVEQPMPVVPDVGAAPLRWGRLLPGRDGTWLLAGLRPGIGEPLPGRAAGPDLLLLHSADDGRHWSALPLPPGGLPLGAGSAAARAMAAEDWIDGIDLALDRQQRPQLVFRADDGLGPGTCQHLWLDGGRWRQQSIGPCSGEPRILIDRDDHAFVIRRVDDGGLMVTARQVPDGPDLTLNLSETLGPVAGFGLDSGRWQRDDVLSLLLVHAPQPGPDRASEINSLCVTAVDVAFDL
jgi:hypothetical protein